MLPTSVTKLSNGRSLRYWSTNNLASPPVVLLHGYPETLQIFSRLAPLLARERPVLVFDWPGLGASEAWGRGASPVQMAERLLAVLDHFRIERAHLLGIDMGGQPALVAAARWPNRVEKLVVSHSLVLWDEATSWEIRWLRDHGWNRFFLEQLPRLVFWRALETFLPRNAPLTSDLRADFWEHFSRREVRRYLSRMCAGYQGLLPRLPSWYENVRCPVLLVWGERERHFPLAQAERLTRLLPRASMTVVPDGEHWMAWHAAEEVAPLVSDFLRRA